MTRTRHLSNACTPLRQVLFRPIDPASLAVFRMLFGAILLWEVWRYTSYGWIGTHFVEPEFFFKYPGFEWVRPWPGNGMYWHFAALGVLAAMITAGLFYRVAMALFFIGFAHVFLIDQARYLNHFYLVALISFLMILAPAARIWSLDALIASRPRPRSIPAWPVLVLVAQIEVMYLYAGLMKIDRDWLRLEPLGEWLAASADLPLIGPLLLNDTIVAIAAYGSIALHLVGAPLLLLKATRIYVFFTYCGFHGLNALFWNIGIFPWFTIAATLLFFPPDWPRTLAARLTSRARALADTAAAIPAAIGPVSRLQVGAVAGFAALWIGLQVLIPLRFLAYPAYVSWHEQGHQFSWQMMLRDKEGAAVFQVRDPKTNRTWTVEPSSFLTERQHRKMVGRPDMIRQFAHHLETVWTRDHGIADVEVRAFTAVSLNGRPSRPLVDPNRDLTSVSFSLRPADWILPFEPGFPPRDQRWLDDMDIALHRLLLAHGVSDDVGAPTPAP